MAELNLLVRLKVPDTVAASAEMALTDLLGHDELLKLEREELWRFSGDFDPNELLQQLLDRTSRFVNPSKHAHRLVATLDGVEPHHSREGQAKLVLVTKRDDFAGRDALTYCRESLGLNGITGVEYGTLWTLWLSADAPADAVEKMVDCSARRKGLLANPHAESYRVL
jgi:hypothetical protein